MMNKISIRFFDDKEVRAVWDDASSKWWFSVADIIGVLTNSKDPRKYWTVLKTRLIKSGSQLTTNCSRFKLRAEDGKQRLSDCLVQDDIILLSRVFQAKKLRYLSSGSPTAMTPSTARASPRLTLFSIAHCLTQ